jgi:gluconate 2-dehydrogenase gamma chain
MDPAPPSRPDGPPRPSRRRFLQSSSRMAAGSWLALHLPTLAGLSACGREAAERGDPLVTLTAREAEAFGALAETILPSDDLPGAREAGVVHFVDLALDRYFPDMLDLIRPGLEDLDRRATAREPGTAGFAELPPTQRSALLREVEDTPFFFVARLLTVAGMFSDPARGGNRGRVGWEVLGMEHAPAFEPPFGYYDSGYGGDDAT